MKTLKSNLLLAFLFISAWANAQSIFNGNFEKLDQKGNPAGWDLTYNNQNKYEVKLDSNTKQQGKYAISITSNPNASSAAIKFPIDKTFAGKSITLVGNIKTENVTDGFAGIWLRVAGADGEELAFETMQRQKIEGTNDWKEYMISANYNDDEAVKIIVGAMLVGKGKIWVDSLRVFIDDKPIDEAVTKQVSVYKAKNDKDFENGSGIDLIESNPQNVKYLSLLGQVWGFLKYYHPAIANGDYNWDNELFRILPTVLKTKNDIEFSSVLEKWIDMTGQIPTCTNCKKLLNHRKIAIEADYGDLFTNQVFTKALKSKLDFIVSNSNNKKHYYVSDAESSNPKFDHEKLYPKMKYPDAAYRLLALYRYWSIIQYFSPNRNLIKENWNKVLPAFIPQVLQATNQNEYAMAMVKLISSTHDTHAFIRSTVYDNFLGKFRLPIQAKFIEDKLVVTGYDKDTLSVKSNLKIGDVISSIDGTNLDTLIKKYAPFTPASNYPTVLRDMPRLYLLRSNNPIFKLGIIRNSNALFVNQQAVENKNINANNNDLELPGYTLINDQVGYIFCKNYKVKDLDSIRNKFKNTKGIIVDMRNYPTDEMEQSLSTYFKPDSSDFVKFTNGSLTKPGTFIYSNAIKSGNKNADYYKGKIVVIVNEATQSNAEFVTMAIQSANNVTVIGSTTAGADGNISAIPLPGDFTTWISGIGVYYPDGTNAQRAGVKINQTIKPTIEGLKKGIDEPLQKAKELIMGN
ncbi:S41 family peptidase [Pedobacter nototheniae]|uniref:S41 family peptidase n=1 Tax=Pedobacter nototheniae TaxID=2488994 RepID=UPI002931A495|nr:S41 family peptidase [Pedobacter nototheniae]